MAERVDAATVKSWLADGREIAFIDVREHGQYGEGHPFLAISIPYSRLELALPALVPNPSVRLVLIDDGDGVATRAAQRAEGLGYTRVSIVVSGVGGWRRAGFTLFAGVNVPSKTFGEMVELQRHTPRVSPVEVQRMTAAGERFVIVDGRPFAEFERMNIPGGICCPNGELALRIHAIAPDPSTTIVVNCAGRTRSIIGAQTLIDLGVPNPVFAVENGTQGWFLAGLELERGASRRHGTALPPPGKLAALAARARSVAQARGVRFVDAGEAAAWLGDAERTTFVLDVRSPEEFAAGSASVCASAPGAQLIQATDQWVGVKGARLLLVDDDGVRAAMTAQWLRQLGHEACVLSGGLKAAMGLPRPAAAPTFKAADVAAVGAKVLRAEMEGDQRQAADIIDVRSSTAFRAGHIAGAVWSIRPRLAEALPTDRMRLIVFAGDASGAARLAAADATENGYGNIRLLDDGPSAWAAAGLDIVATPQVPADTASIDFLFFVHDRHDGNADAARRYLAWEVGLLDQLDADERGVFKVAEKLGG